MNETEQIAQEFAVSLENNPEAKDEFLRTNYQNSIWLQCLPYAIEPVDFWQYGPPIPSAPGFIFLLAEIWYSGLYGLWVICFPPDPAGGAGYEFNEARKIVEDKVAELWGEN